MARIRTIKPEFWKHEILSSLPESTHILAAALLNYADDEGYFNANPGLIKAECSPLREPSVSIHDSLITLSKIGYLQFGSVPDGRRYGRIVSFDEHQRINRPTPSKIKDLAVAWEDSLQTHTQLSEDSLPEGKGKEQGKEGNRELSRVKREPDNRHSQFRSALSDYWESKNPPDVPMPWNASDAKQLSRFLEANPAITEPSFRQMLRHRYASRGVNHSDRPRAWLERITDYANGPLNQFKQPEGTSNVRKSAVAQNLEDLQDIARRLDAADGGSGGLVSESADREDDAGSLPAGVEGNRRPLLVTAV